MAFEKDEIIAESKVAGTHDLSAKVGEYCAVVPSQPATYGRLADLMRRAWFTACRVSPGLR